MIMPFNDNDDYWEQQEAEEKRKEELENFHREMRYLDTSDHALMYDKIMKDSRVFEYADDTLKNDSKLVLAVIKKDSKLLKHVGKDLLNNTEFFSAYFRETEEHFSDAITFSASLKDNKAFFLAGVNRWGYNLNLGGDSVQEDKDVVLASVKKDGLALQYAKGDLKSDLSIALAAVQQNGLAIQYVNVGLREQQALVLAAVAENRDAIEYAEGDMKKDKRLVLDAVSSYREKIKKDPYSIQLHFGDPRYVEDCLAETPISAEEEAQKFNEEKASIIAELEGNGLNIQSKSNLAKKDIDCGLAAARQNIKAVDFLHSSIQMFVKGYVSFENTISNLIKQSDAERYAHEFLLTLKEEFETRKKYDFSTSEVVMYSTAFIKNYMMGKGADYSTFIEEKSTNPYLEKWYKKMHQLWQAITADEDLALSIVKKKGTSLEFLTQSMKGKEAIVLAAVQQDGAALKFASKDMRCKKHIVLAAVKNDGKALQFAPVNMKNDEDIVRAAVEQDGAALQFASLEQKNNKSIALAAVKNDAQALKHVDDQIKPFITSYLSFEKTYTSQNNEDLKKHAQDLLAKVDSLFDQKKVPISELTKVLKKSDAFLKNTKKQATSYHDFIEQSLKSPWSGLQLLGKIMMALSVAVAAIAIVLATTVVGTPAALGVGLLSIGFFATGLSLSLKGAAHDKKIIADLSAPKDNDPNKVKP
jgi:hypothetical protein